MDLQNKRWSFRKSETKMKRITRVIYLTDAAVVSEAVFGPKPGFENW